MTKLTKEQREKYIQDGGTLCPFCGSNDLYGGDRDFGYNAMWQNVTCSACGEEWTDEYELTGISTQEDYHETNQT